MRHGDQELGIPTMKALSDGFQRLIADNADNKFVTVDAQTRLRDELGIDLTAEGVRDNLEEMMAVLINTHRFCQTSSKEEISGLESVVAEAIAGVQRYILDRCTAGCFSDGDDTVVNNYRLFYLALASRARGLSPPWVFTTNYDLFNERAMDRSGVSYSNGFSGTVERRFNPATYRLALAEQLDITSLRWAAVDGFVHFCKLHGSVNWVEEESGLYPIREAHEALKPATSRIMIYPTPSKQSASFGSPYADMFREFQRQVVQDQSVLIVMGYSFGDEHVNNIIFQGLTLPSFRLVAFIDPASNERTRQLASLADPRIWFVWGDGEAEGEKAHYFDCIAKKLLPYGNDQKIDRSIESALRTLLTNERDSGDDEG
jgi:hypothetical protein